MSIDQVFSHIKWVQWIKSELNTEIQFPIVASNDSVALKLGMLHPGKGTTTVRAARDLQISDKQSAVPAGWPNNELISDRIIVPPTMDEETTQKRSGTISEKTIKTYKKSHSIQATCSFCTSLAPK